MSSGTQVDLDWGGIESGLGGTGAPPAGGGSGAAAGAGVRDAAYLTDEEILGIEPVGAHATKHGAVIPNEARNLTSIDDSHAQARRDSSTTSGPRNDGAQANTMGPATSAAEAAMPEWMAALAGDPKIGPDAQQLWAEHQAFRAAFSSPDEARVIADEARAIKEIFPGGAQQANELKQASQSVDRIDAAIFSGDARAQSEVIAEIARANPSAFRSLFAEAAKVLAGMGQASTQDQAGAVLHPSSGQALHPGSGQALRKTGEGWGTQIQSPNQIQNQTQNQNQNQDQSQNRQVGGPTQVGAGRANLESQITTHQSQVTNHQSPGFDPAAYASFERSTNEVVARDVRGSISDTLARVLPEGVNDGAAKRIGEDIFNEVHRALAADRTLSEQVKEVLRDRRFGTAEQQRVSSLLAGRAKQLVPSVARRVIGEWTSSVLGTARSKAARQATAASRVDIAAAGGSLDSMPLRALSSREVNYASMSDDEILGM